MGCMHSDFNGVCNNFDPNFDDDLCCDESGNCECCDEEDPSLLCGSFESDDSDDIDEPDVDFNSLDFDDTDE